MNMQLLGNNVATVVSTLPAAAQQFAETLSVENVPEAQKFSKVFQSTGSLITTFSSILDRRVTIVDLTDTWYPLKGQVRAAQPIPGASTSVPIRPPGSMALTFPLTPAPSSCARTVTTKIATLN
jgi:hypothetical protein